mmetsp:Transcript_94004/g.242894  ORF Transcript_94004/g.242894 Transcript_94004/m.242894 type:complete len:333 (+) Transcript_94004:256-1254(+)
MAARHAADAIILLLSRPLDAARLRRDTWAARCRLLAGGPPLESFGEVEGHSAQERPELCRGTDLEQLEGQPSADEAGHGVKGHDVVVGGEALLDGHQQVREADRCVALAHGVKEQGAQQVGERGQNVEEVGDGEARVRQVVLREVQVVAGREASRRGDHNGGGQRCLGEGGSAAHGQQQRQRRDLAGDRQGASHGAVERVGAVQGHGGQARGCRAEPEHRRLGGERHRACARAEHDGQEDDEAQHRLKREERVSGQQDRPLPGDLIPGRVVFVSASSVATRAERGGEEQAGSHAGDLRCVLAQDPLRTPGVALRLQAEDDHGDNEAHEAFAA